MLIQHRPKFPSRRTQRLQASTLDDNTDNTNLILI